MGKQVFGFNRLAVLCCAIFLGLVWAGEASAQFPVDTRRVASGLTRPVYCTSPSEDFERLFILQQNGQIRILNLQTLTLNAAPFLTFSVSGGTSGGDERGALGLAFHPDYANNGFFYVYYYQGSQTILRRYTVSANPDIANAASATTIITFAQGQGNHNGGAINFGPNDGYLYIGLGDGGGFNDTGAGQPPQGNGQSGATLLGKIVRIDVDSGSPYSIPASNPFVGDPSHLDEIFHKGLRNPYRWTFDRDTGDMWIGDVGQNLNEEISYGADGTSGLNYGWKCMEGSACGFGSSATCTCNSPTLTDPVHNYPLAGGNCAIIGGFVYRGCAIPSLVGSYIFGEFCSSRLWVGELNAGGTSLLNVINRTGILAPPPGQGFIGSISGFGEDALGEIYICDLGGEIFKIVPEDIEAGDCDQDYVLDSCQVGGGGPIVDCNGNLVDDACEILAGTATDCNDNGIPDDCDLASGVLLDCDNSGTADLCELMAGTVEDCNGNLIPDSCDLVSGVLLDLNNDGLPDECGFSMSAPDLSGGPGQSLSYFVLGSFAEDIGAYSLGLSFDTTMLEASEIDLLGTPAEDADFFAPAINNIEGWVTAGVLLDFSPPVDLIIPAAIDVALVHLTFAVAATVQVGDSSALTLEESIGNPTVEPSFAMASGASTTPLLISGLFTGTDATGTLFIRGDSNIDGLFDISDPVNALGVLFSGGASFDCEDAADSNDDGAIDISDPVFALSALFSGGQQPSSPHPACGIDPTVDGLDCTTGCP